MPGPLEGITLIELAGLGPAPFCGMVFADLGADVIRVDRVGGGATPLPLEPRFDLHQRGKRSIGVDLKNPDGRKVVLDLVSRSDALIEGFRPGVTEGLGIGPGECLGVNPALVYGRMTGWGQEGPYAATAGHDIDYIATSGVLHAIGPHATPAVPLNLLGDYGGGGMLLVVGVLAALIEARRSGSGQVVDAAMVDGSALLSTSIHGLMAGGGWSDQRESNFLDGGAPFYAVYETADGRHMAVGALEPAFFAVFVDRLGLVDVPHQLDRERWPEMREMFSNAFRELTQAQWVEVFAGSDGCVAPVRSLSAAPGDPHLEARGTFVEIDGVVQPAPAPRFATTPAATPSPPSLPGEHTDEVLADLGYSPEGISKLRDDGAVG
ncbi:MAG: CaiB/BaiF CoA-transferase family protein [Acidimicrobiia bacterium]